MNTFYLPGSVRHAVELLRAFNTAWLAALFAVLALAQPITARAATLSVVPPVVSCSALLGIDFTHTPDAPFRVDTAVDVPSSADAPKPFCKVTGYASPQVRFEVHLPSTGWTQRFAMTGCGGYCGAVNMPPHLAEAFGCLRFDSGEMVTASHDAGHSRSNAIGSPNTPNAVADGLWALGNPAALVDFAYKGVHKATVATKALIAAYYGQSPRFSYYIGCSDGGRQGLQTAQRFPTDFDGILAGATTLDVAETNTFFHGWNVRSNAASVVPGTDPAQYLPIMTAEKIPALHAAVMRACADLGKGADAMIQDPRACKFDARQLVCRGADNPDCLTPDQARVVNDLWQGPVDETGAHMTAGGMPRGSEPGWIRSMVTPAGVALNLHTSGDYLFAWDWPHYMAQLGDPLDLDVRTFKFTRAEFDKLTHYSQLFTADNPDLRPFAARGGKLLMWHGWTDTGSTPFHSLNYYDAVRRFMGQSAADKALTLYMIPGVYHCNFGPQLTRENFLNELMAWVEDGTHPGRVDVSYFAPGKLDSAAAITRPVFPYPQVARYDGHGDSSASQSFVEAARPKDKVFPDRFEWLGLRNYEPGKQLWCEQNQGAMTCKVAATR